MKTKQAGKMCKWDRENKEGTWCARPGTTACIYPRAKIRHGLCQIITPKKKVKKLFNMGTGDEFVQRKAWAHYSEPHGFYSATDFKTCWNTTPCVITINMKEFKGGNHGKR